MPQMPTHRRLLVAAIVGTTSFFVVLLLRLHFHQSSSDFDQLVVGARRLLAGYTPYTANPLPALGWPIYYPAPALVLGIPFVGLPLPWAHAVFCGISWAVFAWAATEHGDAQLFSLATRSALLAVSLGQWTPLLMASAEIPVLGWIAIVKPNIGLALAVAYGSTWLRGRARMVNLGVGCTLVVLSFLLRPTWMPEWSWILSRPKPHIVIPLTVIGGPVLLLALLRWRRREARLLAALSSVPQTFSSYDSLLVFLVARTRREGIILAIGMLALTIYGQLAPPPASLAASVQQFGPARVALVFFPALVMVLRRPNEGSIPAWLERFAGRVPRWIGGTAPVDSN